MDKETKNIDMHKNLQKIIRGLTIFVCLIFIAMLNASKDNENIFEFTISHNRIDNVLHNYIFGDLVLKLHLYASKTFMFIMVINILILTMAWFFEQKGNKLGYVLHVVGMFLASTSGIIYVMIHKFLGYGKLVPNEFNYFILTFEVIGLLLTIYSMIFYHKIKDEFQPIHKLSGVLTFLVITSCFIVSGIYLWNNISSEFTKCHEANRYIKTHYTEIHQEVAYQNGNIKNHVGIYNDGYLYYLSDYKRLYKIDSSGNTQLLLELPKATSFTRNGIFYYDDGLYTQIKISDEDSNSTRQIVRISATDGAMETITTSHETNQHYGLVDGKLFYEVTYIRDNETVSDVYYVDLTKPSGSANDILFDKSIYEYYLPSDEWFTKYLYNYQGDPYMCFMETSQFIDNRCYFIDDTKNFTEDSELCMDVNNSPNNQVIAEYVANFNIFNETIYYIQRTDAGFDILSCDQMGENQIKITNIPVDLQNIKFRSADLTLGDGFILCRIILPHHSYIDYHINITDGSYKEISFE